MSSREAAFPAAVSATAALCPICVTPARSAFLPTGKGKAHVEVRPLHVCGDCGLQFQTVAPEQDGSIYAEKELTPQGTNPTAGSLLHLDGDVLKVMRELAPGSRLLDVGSGDGRFLQAAAAAGFAAVGVDISPRLAERARARSGCTVHAGSLPELGLPASSLDAVNLDMVLMYVPDPPAMLREVARLLAPRGVCRIRECCSDSLNARMQGRRWWFYGGTTLRVFNQRSMQRLARQAGFAIQRAYHGTEVSWDTWRAFSCRKGPCNPWLDRARYTLKHAAPLGLPLAADRTYYLRKEG